MNTNFKAVMADYVPPINKNNFIQSVIMCLRVKMMDSLNARIEKNPESQMLPLIFDWMDTFQYFDEMKAALLAGGGLLETFVMNANAAAFDADDSKMEKRLINSWKTSVDKQTNKWIRECAESVAKAIFSPKDNRRIYVPSMRFHRWVMDYDNAPQVGGDGTLVAEGYERGLKAWSVHYTDAQLIRHWNARVGQATNSPDYFLLMPMGRRPRTLKMFFEGEPTPVGNWILPVNIPQFTIGRLHFDDPQLPPGETWDWEDGDVVEGDEV
jgi:hypothetical protein